MSVKKLFFLFVLIITILMVQACVPTTTPENKFSNPTKIPQKTATKKTSNNEVYSKTPTHSYYALGTVTVNLCNLRKGPGTNYPIVDYSEKGEVQKIYGINPEQTWLLLDKQQSVWIALSLVSLDSDISNIPIINDLSSLDNFKDNEIPNQQTDVNPTQSYEEPEPTQFAGCPFGCTYHPPGCDIKGNISYKTGEKIYHVPGQEFYNDTVVNTETGERWFCTEQEARNNGWRKSER